MIDNPGAPVKASRLPEGLRFVVIGLSSTAITIAVFNLLVHAGTSPLLHSHPIEAYVIGMVAGTLYSFAGNRYWVFQAGDSQHWVREFVAFGLINIAATALPSLCLAVSRYTLHYESVLADNIAANVVGLLLATVFRYWAYKVLVFGAAEYEQAPADEALATEPAGAGVDDRA